MLNKNTKRRRVIQWSILWLVFITIGLGWRFPWLGYVVPVVMLTGMVCCLVDGRYACGNLCPRGAFLDRIITPVSAGREIPDFFRRPLFRWLVCAALMGFMLSRGLSRPADLRHWSIVFWGMCVITTSVAVLIGLLVQPRLWCVFCPMGTMQSAIGGGKGQLQILGEACRGCRLCEQSCPMHLDIVTHRDKGFLDNRDCLKCSECVSACPPDALSWPQKEDFPGEMAPRS